MWWEGGRGRQINNEGECDEDEKKMERKKSIDEGCRIMMRKMQEGSCGGYSIR